MDHQRVCSCTTEIAAAYLRGNKIDAADLPVLLTTVYTALARAGSSVGNAALTAAVRRSVRPDSIACLECGFRAKMIRRHLQVVHGLSADDYRGRWSLPPDYPLTAPDYSQARSTMAKEIGLGKRGRNTRLP